ncbi:CoA transferase [Microbacterium sp. NPDC091662]|uniref:CoA transferase n=1 Tax=Microbacterium sp. NPDC091662 TaxID=3364211 RepID=UPI003801320F
MPASADPRRSAPPHGDAAGHPDAGVALLDRVRLELGIAGGESVAPPPSVVPLPSRLATAELAWASVSAAMLAAGRSPDTLDPARIAVAYRSDRVLMIDGAAPSVWSPYSAFWETADGWVRTHGNYPHHADGLRAGLHLRGDAGPAAVGAALAARTTAAAVDAITSAGGLAVPVAIANPAVDRSLRERPLVEISGMGEASDSRTRRARNTTSSPGSLPLRGMRVLDLTRVIAGPVCTRTLALLGADVLRLDPPDLPEPEWQHLDTGHGKRSALLDAHRTPLDELLADADAIVLGYRPAALDRLGLHPELLARRHPGLIVAQLSAWGTENPDRAGFDSLVQAESGISLIESAGSGRPGALPAQALDHSAGYLLAAAVTTLLRRRPQQERSWIVRTSLRRVAAELLGMPRRREPAAEVDLDVGPHIARFDVDGSDLVTARPALAGLEFRPPRAWGADQPAW